MATLLSAIIANYNHGAYIADAIESVLANKGLDVECIVVDDGSTDCSREILKGFSADPRVKVIEKDNGGQASCYNSGLEVAQGDLIALFDGDDFWFPHKVRVCWEMIQKHDLMGSRFYIRHPLQRIYTAGNSVTDCDKQSFSTFEKALEMKFGDFKQISTPDHYVSSLKKYRFPVYLGGDFGGSTVASRSAMEAIFPLPTQISKHFGDMYPSMAVGIVANVYGLMQMLGAYRIHGENHSLTRPREPLTFWHGVGEYVQGVLNRSGHEDVRVSFEASPYGRPYLLEQGKVGELLKAYRDRALAGVPQDQGIKGALLNYGVVVRHMLRSIGKGK